MKTAIIAVTKFQVWAPFGPRGPGFLSGDGPPKKNEFDRILGLLRLGLRDLLYLAATTWPR